MQIQSLTAPQCIFSDGTTFTPATLEPVVGVSQFLSFTDQQKREFMSSGGRVDAGLP